MENVWFDSSAKNDLNRAANIREERMSATLSNEHTFLMDLLFIYSTSTISLLGLLCSLLC